MVRVPLEREGRRCVTGEGLEVADGLATLDEQGQARVPEKDVLSCDQYDLFFADESGDFSNSPSPIARMLPSSFAKKRRPVDRDHTPKDGLMIQPTLD